VKERERKREKMVVNPKKAAAAKTSTKKTKKEDDEEEYKQQTSSRVDKSQIHKAVAALRLHLDKVKQEKEKDPLFEDEGDDAYSVLISLRTQPVGSARSNAKMKAIRIPHSMIDLETAELCLIVKDNDGKGHKEAKLKVESMGEDKAGIAKVLGVSKLRNNYKPHEAKRKLCDSYDLFLADERVIPVLPKLLGKTFFKKKRQPIPVDLTKKDWAKEIRSKTSATYLSLGSGTCVRVKTGTSAMSVEDVVENTIVAIEGAVKHIPRRWGNIQSIFVKCNETVALPLYP
jgi:ribosome biogenesis protein UTP30|tara:strand:+ start:59 stop:919 length:861 start_codon:yes stop_codon:yes gene_type:complete